MKVSRPDPRHRSWSSYRFHAQGLIDGLVDEDPVYLSLAQDSKERQKRYRQFMQESQGHEDGEAIQNGLRTGWICGSSDYQRKLEERINWDKRRKLRGRPRKVMGERV